MLIGPHGRRPGRSPFEEIRQVEENSDGREFEYWSAREAMGLLGYARWENMENVIRKAKVACRNSGENPHDNFRDVTKLQAGSQVPHRDVQVTRYGMYLLAMNGDPEKPEIAAAQRYFAIQTYRAERLLPCPQPAPPPAPIPVQESRPWAERFRRTFMPHVTDRLRRGQRDYLHRGRTHSSPHDDSRIRSARHLDREAIRNSSKRSWSRGTVEAGHALPSRPGD